MLYVALHIKQFYNPLVSFLRFLIVSDSFHDNLRGLPFILFERGLKRMSSLQSVLRQQPHELKFGTSGRRGLVSQMSQLELYINALSEILYLQSLPAAEGGIVAGDSFYLACDLRPSSTQFIAEFSGNGELAQAILRAIQDAGMKPVFLGFLPTPALTNYAIRRQKGSIMVTGSHIPFDRNGYKTNTSMGELLKKHEQPIGTYVARERERLFFEEFEQSLFDEYGRFKTGPCELSAVDDSARAEYLARYQDFFAGESLAGLRLVCYQHSAVGRDMLVELLRSLGAEVIPMGRSESFVPIDTENIDDASLQQLDAMVRQAAVQHGPIDALVSTDGDSDRPLVLGVRQDGSAQFVSGDRLGMIVADYLGADAVVVPISCNDAIDRSPLAAMLEPKTRIGSPFVIAGMEEALLRGKQRVCGWEANGGFLTGSPFVRNGHSLTPLPTRDAVLPILCALFAARQAQLPLCELLAQLPQRFGRSALLKNFPRTTALRIVAACSPPESKIRAVHFEGTEISARDAFGAPLTLSDAQCYDLENLCLGLGAYFSREHGFSAIMELNYTDGVRIAFHNGDVAHIRPSGNADELRIYAFADNEARAASIAAYGVEEPNGLLRQLQKAVTAS
jgi:phosphomannomutase